MPYTVSHAAVAIPLNRRPMVASALIVGSMSPDFLYFIPGMPHYHFTHTLAGLLLFCVPVSLFVFYLFEWGLRNPLISLLPDQLRLAVTRGDDGGHLLAILASILVGAATHIGWDSFTHANGQMVQRFDVLSVLFFEVYGQPIYLYKLLQYMSTVLGGLAILFWIGAFVHSRLKGRNAYISTIRQLAVPIAVLIACATLGFFTSIDDLAAWGFNVFVVQSVVTAMSLCVLAVLCYAVVWHVRRAALE